MLALCFSEAIIAVIMTAMPLPSPPLCRFPGGGQRKALTFRAAEAGGVRHPGIVPGTITAPAKRGTAGAIFDIFRGLWQPTE